MILDNYLENSMRQPLAVFCAGMETFLLRKPFRDMHINVRGNKDRSPVN